MDTETLFKVIKILKDHKTFATEDLDIPYDQITERDHMVYAKGQTVALDGVINRLQDYIDYQVSAVENQTGE